MKELSIEEKAEAYDEAIEQAEKELTVCRDMNCDAARQIFRLFPQLEAAKEEKVDNANKVEPKDYNDIDPHFGKPIDKVVPKFKVGDWVVTDKCDTVQIGAVNNGYYTLYNGMIFNMSYVDKCWHLWSITDAKDGDVLINWNNTAFIFKDIEDETVKFHIAYNEEWDAIKTPSTKLSHLGLPEPQFEFHPATKEQRDLLFQKMKEEGYEWDAEKKEPKKTEQNPAWSEGDEEHIKRIIEHFEGRKKDLKTQWVAELHNKEIEWLKSLRPQNRWKPSDEQIGALEHFVRSIAESGFASPYDSNTKLVYSLFNDLKKLREE